MNKQTGYRPDIDGLRAVAVLLVVGFHAFPNVVAGGYVGVDIFFVISGFLITTLLVQDLQRKKLSFSRFYARRIRRIFPALALVLFVCFAAGWVLLLPAEFKSLGLTVFGGAAFSSNFVLLGELGYFDSLTAAQRPLLHLWSLGIEEQFYIVWPVLLLLAFSRRLSIAVLALVLLIASFAWNVRVIGSTADFYLPTTRAWELMIGGIMAAMVGDRLMWGRSARVASAVAGALPHGMVAIAARANARAVLGVGFIVAAVSAGGSNSGAFPGWWALLPTLGTALIISSDGAWLNRNILSNAAVVLIGLISYPLYLWHWPLLYFTNIVAPEPAWPARLAVVFGAAALAWMTYRWIEHPVRTGPRHPLQIAILCIAMALIGSAGLATLYWQGIAARVPAPLRDILDVHPDLATWSRDKCLLDRRDPQSAADCLQRGRSPLVFLWGDSLAGALYPGLRELQHSRDFNLAQYTNAGCPPLPALRPYRDCVEGNDFVMSVLAAARPDIVLLHSTWDYQDALPGLRSLVDQLRLLHIPRIVVLGPPAAWAGGLPGAAFRYYRLHSYLRDPVRQLIPVRSSFAVSEAWHANQQRLRNEVLSWGVEPGVEYVSAWDAMCDGEQCLTRVGDKSEQLIVFDHAHLTHSGAIYLAEAIAPCLFPNGTERRAVSIVAKDPISICYPSGADPGTSAPR